MTTDEIMVLAGAWCDSQIACEQSRSSIRCQCGPAFERVRSAVDTLVAERDALLTERDTLRQVIEQQLLNVPVGEWKK